ncbi:potassium channel beta subunit family protein [Candidatus Neomarinimicrobiota bacterium]
MEYRRLGSAGIQVSALSFGSWVTFGDQVDENQAYEMMKAAFDAGVNFFDNAEAYAKGVSETIMGNVLKRAGWKRSELVISTKLFWGPYQGPNSSGLSRKHIHDGINDSLRRMQLDYVDLLFCHRHDLHTPIEETVWAMNQVIKDGKALYWGTSEWSAEQLREAYNIARREHLIPPTMEQPQYHMFHRDRVEREYANLYTEIGLGTTIWSPLAGGILTGKYSKGIPEDSRMALKGYEWLRPRVEGETGQASIRKADLLMPIAKELDMSLPQLALAWCLTNPDVSTVITGASKVSQVTDNMQAVDMVDRLTPELLEKIEVILDNRPPLEHDWR